MPIYEYLCGNCKKRFAVREPISKHEKASRKRTCPKCKSRNTHQLFSSFFAKTSTKS